MPKILIHSFIKNKSQEIRISAGEFKAKIYIDFRLYYHNDETDEMLPTRKGLTVPVELVDAFQEGLNKIQTSQLTVEKLREE